MIDEYLQAKQLPDIKDTVTELSEVHHVPRAIIAGNFVLYAYTKKPEEFRIISSMLLQLVKEGVLFDKELQEAYFDS